MRDAEFYHFVTKNSRNDVTYFCQFSMMAAKKKQDSIAFFYELNHKKAKVYENNWGAENRDQLLRKIQKGTQEFDMELIIKMFDHLKAKIRKADQDG